MQFKRCEKSFAVSFLSQLRLFHELKLRGKTTSVFSGLLEFSVKPAKRFSDELLIY